MLYRQRERRANRMSDLTDETIQWGEFDEDLKDFDEDDLEEEDDEDLGDDEE